MTHVFTIRNLSTRELHIVQKTTSCGCTVVGNTEAQIKPLMNLEVPVRVNLASKNGKFDSQISLKLSDGRNVELMLRGEFYPQLPKDVNLGTIRRGEALKKYALPSEFSTGASEIKPEVNGSALDARILRESDSKVLLSLSAKKDAAAGPFEIEMTLHGAATLSRATRLVGRIATEVEAETEMVSFGYVDQAKPLEEKIATAKFYSPYLSQYTFESAASELPDGVEFLSSSGEENGRTSVNFKLRTSNLPVGLYNKQAVCKFRVGTQLVSVPIRFYGYVIQDQAGADSGQAVHG